jgi:hypothetical protein
METKKLYQNSTFVLLVIITLFLAFWVRGFIFAGMFMGLVSTIAIWVLVLKFPPKLQNFMGNHVLISDLILTMIAMSGLSVVGPGATVFMAMCTQAVLTSILLPTLKTS